jgi:hypothetical protein
VLARAIGLSWETTRSIMTLAAKRYRHSRIGIALSVVTCWLVKFFSHFREPRVRLVSLCFS